MEEKINNQKIFSYIPTLIARLILNSSLQDKDIFSDNTNIKQEEEIDDSICGTQSKGRSTFLTSFFINPSIYPINHNLPNTIVMNIRLKGFQKLISTLSIKDPNDQREKMISEYLSIITPKLLLDISKIISNNGGEIIKYNDYEFTTIWNFTPKKNKLQRYEKFYAKQALLSANEIMNEVDGKEIANGIKIKISIGIAMGNTMITFFGGERKRGEYIVLGETIQKAEICMNYCLSHEIIISEEINSLFNGSDEITTKEVDNEENLNLYLIIKFNEDILKNLKGFKIKMKYDKLNMTKSVYENLAKKVYIFSSILPQGLVKYLDVDQDQNLKEISVVTIATIHIIISKTIVNNLKKIQNIILDIQKATYLTFGSLLYISKTYNGFLARCVWGMDPGSFVDDTARCISACILIGLLSEHYEIKIAIGISTGSCYTGLIPIQGNRKQFTLLGKKVNLSRTLADEAFQKIINSSNTNSKRKYVIFCDKKTMEQSQKWFRHVYISKINIYFNKESQDIYYETKEELNSANIEKLKSEDAYNNNDNYDKQFLNKVNDKVSDKVSRNNICIHREYNRKSIEYFKKSNTKNDALLKNIHVITTSIYSPCAEEEYFIQNNNDPFPYIRTHKHNCYSPKIKQYFYNHFQNTNFDTKIQLNLIGNLPMNISNSKDIEKMNKIFQKSQVIYGYDNEINKFVNIMNIVTKKSKKQFMLIKGPLGVGKTLFLRKCLNKYLDNNEELKNIYFNKDDFFLCGKVDPLTATFPYNNFCFLLRKIFLYLKKLNKLDEIKKLINELSLDNDNIKHINFVLSMGKKDINIKDEGKELRVRTNYRIRNNSIIKNGVSVISELEGPHKIKDSNKIDNFFFEMIKLYKNYLNLKYNDPNKINFKSNSKIKNKVPLILIVDDIQMSDKYSIDFIRYLFNNDEKKNNPFIVILVEQTPFNKNFRPILHRELEFFLSAFSDIEDNEKIENDKIILFEIKPIMEKDLLKNILIDNFQKYVSKNYPPPTKLLSIDSQILNFILKKTFLGIPLLAIELFESLIKSQNFIQMVNNEYIITKELEEDNSVFDWSNLLLPYIYEKITSNAINSLLSFKEILLLKYACTIGTFFDVQTLDKINPLNLIIKKEDLINIMEKLNNEYIIEIFENENMNRKTKKCMICKICFPFMREVLHKKFPIERRASLHAETAKLLSGGKKVYYFNSQVEGIILKRHLIYSEINVVDEIESKTNQDIIVNSYRDTKIVNTNNLTVLFVKDVCSRIFDKNYKNILEGGLDMIEKYKWIKIQYYVDRQYKIYFNKIKTNKNEKDLQLVIPIKDIFKNIILPDNNLEITIAEYSNYLMNKSKKMLTFHSDNWQDIFHLNTALTFLRMIANYEKYVYNFGYTKLPLYKKDWYQQKEKKYYANLDQGQLFYSDFRPFRTKRFLSCFGLVNQTDKLILESKDLNRPFNFLMQISFTLFISNIQFNLTKNRSQLIDELDEEHRLIQGKIVYLIYILTPPHMQAPVQKLIEEEEKKQKEEEKLLRTKYKGKFSIFPQSLLKRERRTFGSGIVQSKRNQSIIMIKPNIFSEDKKTSEEKEKKLTKSVKYFFGRKERKSKTVSENNEQVTKKIANKNKSQIALNVVNINNSSENEDDSSTSKSKSDESDEEQGNSNFKDSSCDDSSESEKEEKKNKLKENIKNTKILSSNNVKESNNNINEKIKEDKNNNIININNEKKDNNLKENYNINNISNKNIKNKDNDTIKINKYDISNNNTQTNINTKNNYNINNYINNSININLINNNYLNSTLNHPFIKNKLLDKYYEPNLNININSLRMSYQPDKFHIKLKPKINSKKSLSAEVKSLKEKYRNNSNNYLNLINNSANKISFEEFDEESMTSDKESENNVQNLFLVSSPQVNNNKKKNSKTVSEITPTKEDIFSKAVIAFLGDENTEMATPNKDDIYKWNRKNSSRIIKNSNNFKYKNLNLNNIEEPKNTTTNTSKPKKRIKRSSLLPSIKVQIRNKTRHVTFTQEKEEEEENNQTNKNNYKNKEIPQNYSKFKNCISSQIIDIGDKLIDK